MFMYAAMMGDTPAKSLSISFEVPLTTVLGIILIAANASTSRWIPFNSAAD